MEYESFSIRIESASGDSYALSVRSPRGETQGTLRVAQSGQPLLAGAELGPDRGDVLRELVRRLSNPAAPALDVGKTLFQALFREEVANLFHASLGSLRGRHQGLRISISINPRVPHSPSLQKLPWELLCRPETEDFLCLSRRTPVVRYLEAHRAPRPAIARPSRLRILAIAANPTGCCSLDVAQERANLQSAWQRWDQKVEITFLERGGLEEIRQALLAAPFHIVHFMGHGTFDPESGEGVFLFEGHDGAGQPFAGRRLAQLLHDFRSLRLVVLNACHTADAVGKHGANPFAGAASALVMGGVPAVVAMSGPISDPAAVAFSRMFYQRLAAGDVIEAAMTEGRLAIQRVDPATDAWATPVLFLRGPDGALFAPRSTVWARRAALLTGLVLAIAIISVLVSGWLRERRAAEVMRLTNDGIGLLELGRTEEAQKALRSALDIDPANAAALGNLSIVELQLGDDEPALAHAQAAAAAAPQEAIHQYNLGSLLSRKQRYEEAISCLRRAVEIDPGYVFAYNELGNLYLELGHPAEARKALEVGLSHDPTAAKLHKNLGRVALAEGQPDEAIHHLETGLSLVSPADAAEKAEATYWLATAQARAGRATEACEALYRFKILDPHLLNPLAKDAKLLAEQRGCPQWP